MAKVQGILFDMDGTLVNTNELILACFDHATTTCLGKLYPHAGFIQYFGRPLVEGLEALFPGRGQELAQEYRNYQLLVHDQKAKAIPGMYQTLTELQKRDIKLAIVTSKFEVTARKALQLFNLEKFFSCVIGNGQVKKPKPDAEPSLAALKVLGLNGADCLCVGDSPYDLISGRAAGCRTVAVNYSLFDHGQLLKLGQPDYCIDKPEELLTLLDR
ncbi:MAG: HAD-IA family hydrolase [Acidaminococcaceae bacterium]|nr:HAD-IA family hydrolase [Acidaminococcaceae bacterium]